jgi:ADP-heptose:LPS heptosyltransferase
LVDDEVALTGVVREVKRVYPKEFLFVECSRPELFECNRHVGFGQEQKHGPIKLTPFHSGRDYHGNLIRYYGRQLGITCFDDTPELHLTEKEQTWAKGRLSDLKGKRVAFDIFATWVSRQWPAERFTQVVSALTEMGVQTVELGKKVEDNLGNYVTKKRLPVTLDLFNKLSVRETAAILSECDLLVGNDSGLMHLAAAVGTPQVAIYTISPWWSRAYWNTTPVFTPKPCNIECGMQCVRKEKCINDIQVESVLAAIGQALRRYSK